MGPLIQSTSESPMDPKEIVERVGEPLKDAIYKELELPAESNRQAQIATAKRNLLYMQGKQYLAPQMSSDGRSWDWRPVQLDDKDGKKKKFASTYNIVSADGVKYMAVVGQRSPNVKAVPLDPMRPNEVSLATDAQTAALYLHKLWDIRRRLKEIAFYQWSTSAVFLHTQYVADEIKYGVEQYPVIDTKPEVLRPAGMTCMACGMISMATACPECGGPTDPFSYQDAIEVQVPFQNGVQSYAKGEVELEILTTFEVGHSFGARTLKECQFLTIDMMKPEWLLKSVYSLDDRALAGGDVNRGSVTDAQAAKEAVESPNGVPCYDKVAGSILESRKYIRPLIYHAMNAEQKKIMQTNYPTGALVTIVGNKVVRIEHKNMDDYVSICKTGTGPLISDPPLCNGIIPIQDDINDCANLGRETILRGIPKTLVDATLLSPQAIKENEAIAGELVRVKIGNGQSIGSLYGQLPVATMSEQMMPFIEWEREMSREIDGMQPAVYGGGTPSTTFRGENQRKNQALMQLQPGFEELQSCVVVATKNGVKEMARYRSGEVKVTSRDPMVPTRRLQLERLQVNGWDMEADESAPVSVAEKQERISGISQENPALATTLGFSHPMNTGNMQVVFGVDGFYTPGAAQQKKAMATIQILLQEQGIDDVDPMTGAPLRMPSQMPDPYEFKDAAFMAEVFRAWVLSDAGQEMATVNPSGFENVKLFGGQLDLMAVPPMPMEPPPDGSAAPPPPPPNGAGPGPMPEAPLPPA